MMLPSQGPTSSLMEDLVDLGLAEGNAEPKAEKGKENSTLPPQGKADSAHGSDDSNVAGDEDSVAKRQSVNVRNAAASKKPAQAEDEEIDSGKMVPSFMIPTESEVQEAEEQAEAQAEEDQLTKAWQVVHAYFSEDHDGLNEEGLRGVINAMGFALNTCVEDIANLTVENTRLTEAVQELTGLLHEADEQMKRGDEDEDEDEGEDEDEDEDEGKGKPWMKAKKDDEGEGKCESRRVSRRNSLTEDASLNSLLDEIRGIGTEAKPTKALDLQAKLIEGFESVQSSCNDIVGRIVQVIADDQGVAEDEQPEMSEDDERVQIAQFFYGIAEDAEAYLARLSEGDVPFKVAEADLAKIYADMEKGIEAMHTVE